MKIGVVADLAVPLEVVVLLIGSLVRPGDPAGVRDVLHRRAVRRDRQVSVGSRSVIPRWLLLKDQAFLTPRRKRLILYIIAEKSSEDYLFFCGVGPINLKKTNEVVFP